MMARDDDEDDDGEEHEVVCSRGLSAVGGPELMSLLCQGDAEVEAMTELFDLLADENLVPSLAAGQTLSRDAVLYLVMKSLDSAARAALGSVYSLASGEALARDARLLLVERVDRAQAEGIEAPEPDPEGAGSATLSL